MMIAMQTMVSVVLNWSHLAVCVLLSGTNCKTVHTESKKGEKAYTPLDRYLKWRTLSLA